MCKTLVANAKKIINLLRACRVAPIFFNIGLCSSCLILDKSSSCCCCFFEGVFTDGMGTSTIIFVTVDQANKVCVRTFAFRVRLGITVILLRHETIRIQVKLVVDSLILIKVIVLKLGERQY